MGKKKDSEAFKNLDVILPQGARSRHRKALDALEAADNLIPDDALGGTSEHLRQALMQLQTAQVNITELIAYRKIMGVD